MRDSGMTIVLTTHYLDEAERLCDRIAIVHAGEIVALDTPAALLGRLGPEILELRVGADVDALLSFLRAHGHARQRCVRGRSDRHRPAARRAGSRRSSRASRSSAPR